MTNEKRRGIVALSEKKMRDDEDRGYQCYNDDGYEQGIHLSENDHGWEEVGGNDGLAMRNARTREQIDHSVKKTFVSEKKESKIERYQDWTKIAMGMNQMEYIVARLIMEVESRLKTKLHNYSFIIYHTVKDDYWIKS